MAGKGLRGGLASCAAGTMRPTGAGGQHQMWAVARSKGSLLHSAEQGECGVALCASSSTAAQRLSSILSHEAVQLRSAPQKLPNSGVEAA